jgi:hypothetical protein
MQSRSRNFQSLHPFRSFHAMVEAVGKLGGRIDAGQLGEPHTDVHVIVQHRPVNLRDRDHVAILRRQPNTANAGRTPFRTKKDWRSKVINGNPSGSSPQTNWQLSFDRPLALACAHLAEMASGRRPKATTSKSLPGNSPQIALTDAKGNSGGRQIVIAPLLKSRRAAGAL